MRDVLAWGLSWLREKREAHRTRPVQYTRKGQSATVNATAGRSEFDQAQESGVIIREEIHDELISTVLLAPFGEPERGDQISEMMGDKTVTYEVFSTAGQRHFAYTTPAHETMRIHTKLVSVK